MTRILLCTALGFALGSGCSKAQPEASDGAGSPAKAETHSKSEAAVQIATARAPSLASPLAAQPASGGPDCHQVCAPVRKLNCRRASECVDSCREMVSGKVCQKELLQFYACLSTEPAEHWECLDDGTGAIKEGFCEREQAIFAAC